MNSSGEAVSLEAQRTDGAIDAVLQGRAVPPDADRATVAAIRALAVMRQDRVPGGVADVVRARVREARRRSGRIGVALRVCTALLAALFAWHGSSALFFSEELAEFLELTHEPHIYQEAGILALAIGVGLGMAAFRLRLAPGILAIALPAAVGLGVFGMIEIPHAPNPAAEILHFGQAAGALVVAALWWLWRRGA